MKKIRGKVPLAVLAGIGPKTKSITRRMLADYYYSYDIKTCCHLLGISKNTLYKRLKDAKIEKKGQGVTKKTKLIISDIPIDDQISEFKKDLYCDRTQRAAEKKRKAKEAADKERGFQLIEADENEYLV